MPFCWCRINCFRRKCARPCAESYDTLYQFIFISVESHELFPYTAIIAEEGLVPKATIRCISSFSSQLSLRNCVPGRPTHCVLHFYLQGTTTPDTRATPSGCERELIHQQQLPPPTPHNSTRWWTPLPKSRRTVLLQNRLPKSRSSRNFVRTGAAVIIVDGNGNNLILAY